MVEKRILLPQLGTYIKWLKCGLEISAGTLMSTLISNSYNLGLEGEQGRLLTKLS